MKCEEILIYLTEVLGENLTRISTFSEANTQELSISKQRAKNMEKILRRILNKKITIPLAKEPQYMASLSNWVRLPPTLK